jgi:DNA-binding transcriptional MerR regulator
MATNHREAAWRIGELALRAGTSTDTVRYYERFGLLGAAARSEGGYRLYGEPELRRLQFIRRAKLLGLSLEEIRGLLGLAEEGECRPLRRQVAELLRAKIDECEVKLTELRAFKVGLEERYQVALASQEQPACSCAAFPASCACLPVQIEEVGPLPTATASPRSGHDGMDQ